MPILEIINIFASAIVPTTKIYRFMVVYLSTFEKRKGFKPERKIVSYKANSFQDWFGIMNCIHKLLGVIDSLLYSELGSNDEVVFKITIKRTKRNVRS